ncbi:hypothetical protein NGM10_01955 [Halorussus salilacus]|uniref:hypothetical protein n=1 Tax=Halorussus salilacus TaxID=2953750 RepID=UPI00209F090C|nr:hypothetical protein [Halorussus salilacus]USZ68516.1 hypothetical protein NGM10_01955 [Halorussus salilacus]
MDPDLERAQQWWSTNSQDESLQLGNSEIRRVTAALDLPKCTREEASRLFYVATVEENHLHGRSIELVVAGSVYTAAYLNSIPQTPREVANEVGCNTNDVHKGHRLVVGQTYVTKFRPDAVDYLPRFAQALHAETGLDYQHTANLQSMAHHLIDKTFSQKPNTSARVLAASALYAASHVEEVSITQSDVATATDVDEATISRHYKTFLNRGS